VQARLFGGGGNDALPSDRETPERLWLPLQHTILQAAPRGTRRGIQRILPPGDVATRDESVEADARDPNPQHGVPYMVKFRGGGCDSRLTALSDAERSSVEPQYYSTYRELQLRISTIPTLKSTEVVGNLLAACWLLVGCLF